MQTTSQPSRSSPSTLNIIHLLPLLWISLAFLGGIAFASVTGVEVWVWLLLMLAALAFAALTRMLPRLSLRFGGYPIAHIFLILLAAAGFCAGAARYKASAPRLDASDIAWYADREYEVLVTGTVADPPDARDTYTNLRINTSSIDTGDETLEVHGLILARVPPEQEWHYGDKVRLRGHLKTPPEFEDFSYKDYLARHGILAYMPGAEATLLPFSGGDPLLKAIYAFKDRSAERLGRLFQEPEASLLTGILLGDDNGMPAELQQAYKNTGTAHIIAISGFNIAIIAGLFVWAFSRLLGRRWGAVAAIAGIALYTILVGASPSVLRAAVMGALALFAVQIGRRQNGLMTLAFTAAVMALIDPNILWDVGFQLSFAATLGLVLFAQPLEDWFTGLLTRRFGVKTAEKIAGAVGAYVLFTWAAQVTTLPVMATQFRNISLISLLVNPLVLPVQPLVMVLGGLALLLSYLYFPLGQVAAWVAWPFAAYTNRVVELFNRIPHITLQLGDFALLALIVFYLLLFLLVFGGAGLRKAARRALAPAVVLTLLAAFTYLSWSAARTAPDGKLHLVFLDAGSADAILIQTPTGHTLLINGGESPSNLASALGKRISPFDRKLDWLIVASPQENQVAALPRLMQLMPPENVLWAGNTNASYAAEAADEWLVDNKINVTPATKGAELDLGEGARLKVLTASAKGAVLLVEWDGFRALLPMGVNFDVLGELDYGKSVGSVTALLLADSGFGPSNPPEWIENLQPQVLVLSVKAADPNGLPDPGVVEMAGSANLLRTDLNGWIEISTDGKSYWVDVEKK